MIIHAYNLFSNKCILFFCTHYFFNLTAHYPSLRGELQDSPSQRGEGGGGGTDFINGRYLY